jgi:hypothetical protein
VGDGLARGVEEVAPGQNHTLKLRFEGKEGCVGQPVDQTVTKKGVRAAQDLAKLGRRWLRVCDIDRPAEQSVFGESRRHD